MSYSSPVRVAQLALVLALTVCCCQAYNIDPDTRDARPTDGGLREATAHRNSDLARAPDGTHVHDQPLSVLRARRQTQDAADSAYVGDSGAAGPAGAAAGSTQPVSLWLLLVMTMVMALLSGVGALPYLFTGKLDPYWSGIANAVGCGVMLAASFDLLEESKSYSATAVLAGIVLGVLAMAYSQAWLGQYEDVSFSDLQGADARKAMLIIGVMAAHAFGEGSGVGVSFSGPRGWAQGLLVTIAIGLHNIPEGMAVATIMVARGTPPSTALYWTLLAAVPQGIVAVPAYMFVETFSGLLPIALGFAAGCMIWIVFAELIPDALETADHGHVATAATLSAASLQAISMAIAKLEQPDGSVASPIQADLGMVLGKLLVLAVALGLAPAAAALGSHLLPSLPMTLGVSVGVGAWLGLGGLVSALVHHAVAKHTLVLFAGAGAATCAGMWKLLSARAAGEGAAGGKGGDEEGGLEHQHQHASDPQLTPAHANGAAGAGWSVPPPPPGSTPPSAPHSHASGVEVWASGVPGGPGAGGGLAGHSVQGLERRTGFVASAHHLHVNGGGKEPHPNPLAHGGSGGGGMGAGGLHCQGNCNCKECDSKGKPLSAHAWSQHAHGAPHAGLDLLPAADRPRDCVQSAALLGCMLLLAALPAGYDAAAGLLGHLGDVGAVLVPLALKVTPLGLACVGIVRSVAGAPGWKGPVAAAASFGLLVLVVVAGLLLPLPAGKVPADTILFDPSHMADKLRAFAAGGVLLAAGGYMWPAACHFKPRKVQLGVGVGLGVCAAVSLACAGLCAATPYCLDRGGQ